MKRAGRRRREERGKKEVRESKNERMGVREASQTRDETVPRVG
jgi:hypothetical protein